MSFGRKSNLKELSVAEIDDLIKEKSCTLKYTEDKLSKCEISTSTHRRRDNMKSTLSDSNDNILTLNYRFNAWKQSDTTQ